MAIQENSMQYTIRPFRNSDTEVLYKICLETGYAGTDATSLYSDPKLLGHIYLGPYIKYYPQIAFVLEDNIGICGYVIGSLNTLEMQSLLTQEWYPMLQKMYASKAQTTFTVADNKLIRKIYEMDFVFPTELVFYPSELHIDILPRTQGKGYGSKLIFAFLEVLRHHGSCGIHLGADPNNLKAIKFYEKLGFAHINTKEKTTSDAVFMGMRL